jgi:hypothetical protein
MDGPLCAHSISNMVGGTLAQPSGSLIAAQRSMASSRPPASASCPPVTAMAGNDMFDWLVAGLMEAVAAIEGGDIVDWLMHHPWIIPALLLGLLVIYVRGVVQIVRAARKIPAAWREGRRKTSERKSRAA